MGHKILGNNSVCDGSLNHKAPALSLFSSTRLPFRKQERGMLGHH